MEGRRTTKPSTAKRPPAAKVRRRMLASEIAETIRQRGFRPGEWLRQIDLEERFKATRFDVRSALEELAVKKTIEHVPNRGYRVAQIDAATARHIRETRVVLEQAAVPAIVASASEADIARLKTLAAAFGAAVRGGTEIEQSETNRNFHRMLLGLCGNPVLEEVVWALRDRSRGSGVTVWTSHESLLQSDRDHLAMIAALEARDIRALRKLFATHIIKGPPATTTKS